MPGVLVHSPADVVRRVMIAMGLGVSPANGSTTNWPIYAESEPDRPDNVITVYNTSGRSFGSTQPDGEQQEHHGIQVRVRSITPEAGWTKANALAIALDEDLYQETVTIDGSTYTLHSVDRTGSVLPLGRNTPTDKRSLFTINAMAVLRAS